MSIPVTFLEGSEPLRKSYSLDSEGKILVEPYPHVLRFTSHTEYVKDLKGWLKQMELHAAAGHCLLKGVLQKPLQRQSRQGSTDPAGETAWLCLDVDGLPGIGTVEDFLALLGEPFTSTSYIAQYSSSMQVMPEKGLSAHVFMLLDKPYPAPLLKKWLIHTNLNQPLLASHLRLNKSSLALRFPLDVSTCQNDKLIYIAPPEIDDRIKVKESTKCFDIKTRKHKTLALALDLEQLNHVDKAKTDLVTKLREERGLKPIRKAAGRPTFVDDEQVMTDTGSITVTGEREARGFIYFNLNGGDSWGYYTPTDDPEIVHNFKGEPPFFLKEVRGDTYERLKKASSQVAAEKKAVAQQEELKKKITGLHYFVAMDVNVEGFIAGCWDYDNERFVELLQPKKEVTARTYAKVHGLPVPDPYPIWKVVFDVKDPQQWHPDECRINLFRESDVVLAARARKAALGKCPEPILQLITHVCGDDPVITERFLNWLAVIVQHKSLTGTAWVFSGTTGTGKGALFRHVLEPIIGSEFAKLIHVKDLQDAFNGFMERCQLLFVDEIEASMLTPGNMVESRMKSYITEKTIPMRSMHTMSRQVKNHMNVILASNKNDAMEVAADDRRYNVCPRQEMGILAKYGPNWINERIKHQEEQLIDFAHYLLTRPADSALAADIIRNEAHVTMAALAEDSNQTIASYLKYGNRDELLEALEHADTSSLRHQLFEDRWGGRKDVPLIGQLMTRIQQEEESALSLSEVALLFYHMNNFRFEGQLKFKKFLGKKGVPVKTLDVDGKRIQGVRVTWRK